MASPRAVIRQTSLFPRTLALSRQSYVGPSRSCPGHTKSMGTIASTPRTDSGFEDTDTSLKDTDSKPASAIVNDSLHPHLERLRTHQFDTYRLVLSLQRVGYSRNQAVALMKCLRAVLETYLFRAAMSELRTELKTQRQNEAAAERAEIVRLQKELDALNQKTREDLENLRNDVTIEMNNRKIATRAEQQAMEVKIQDLNYNFTKRLADMRTEVEAQKWQTTRLLISPFNIERL